MNIRAIAIAALVSVAVPATAFAQANLSVDAGVNAGVGGSADAMSGDVNVTAGAATDFNAFMQGMSGAGYTSATSDIDAATSFTVVKISTLADADANRLKEAIQPHASDIAALDARIEANAKAKAALEAQGLSPDDVVWVDSGADGTVTLYVNDLETM